MPPAMLTGRLHADTRNAEHIGPKFD